MPEMLGIPVQETVFVEWLSDDISRYAGVGVWARPYRRRDGLQPSCCDETSASCNNPDSQRRCGTAPCRAHYIIV